jgi:tetratricopeptide (TPR) repeat protein
MKQKRFGRLFLFLIVLLLLSSDYIVNAQIKNASAARIWEQDITLPTYLVGAAGKNPQFYFGRAYQGAQGRVYPYPSQEYLTDERIDKIYKFLCLENEYIKISLLPEIGGRLFSALDKTNNYDFIYKQSVIRPALVGMMGAWIDGGIEWNVFHHHRPSSFKPVDYSIQENSDGSVTAWVGETEIRQEMNWRLGVTIYPGKSYIEATLVPYNRSPFLNTMLYFANAGVHSNDNYQVIFAPATEWVTQHAKAEYAGWPIAHETYNQVNFEKQGKEFGTDGVDISWWKNNITQASFFAYNYEDDWMAGYDHGKETGTCIVGSHYTAPGKKFWTWGNGPEGDAWDKTLTEKDGHELELMAGGFSDNEPDYSWIQPYETKKVTHYFYPIRNMMGSVKNANREAAVNLEINDNKSAIIAYNSTSLRKNAKVNVKVGDKVIFEETIEISPLKPYTKKVVLPENTKPETVTTSLLSAEGEELISYCPAKTSPGAFPGYEYKGDLENGTRTPMPEPVVSPGNPKEIESVEMLYLAGSRLEQFFNPSVDPMIYYEEALKRDPENMRVNCAVGIHLLRQAKFEEAEKYLKKSVQRAVWNYTRPKDTEPFYYHGLALKHLGRYKEAYDNFYAATWDIGFHSAGNLQLARLDCMNGCYDKALDHLESSLSTSVNNLSALNLKASVLRKSGNPEEARKLSSQVASEDLLDFWSRNELYLSLKALGQIKEADEVLESLKKLMRDEVNSYLILSVEYGNCGLWDEAIEIVERLINMNRDGRSTYPLLYYYAAYAFEQKGDQIGAAKYYKLANQMPVDYCFPFQLEMVHVLMAAMAFNPNDEKAPYYLGNLLYDLQPEAAIKEWEKSKDLGADFATVYRNLGVGYNMTYNDLERSMRYYEKAVELNPDDSRVLFELEDVYKKAQEPHEKRLAMLQKYHYKVIKSNYLVPLEREIELYNLLGQYDKALKMMTGLHFRRWEGGANVFTSFLDANLLRGTELMKEKQYDKALLYFKAAMEFPENMEACKDYASDRSCEVLYFLGNCYEAMGKKKLAMETYNKASAQRQYDGRLDVPMYYHAMALKKLGHDKEAELIFNGIIKNSEAELNQIGVTSEISFFAKFGERGTNEVRKARAHYMIGLGLMGLDQTDKAIVEFTQSLELDNNHIWAKTKLDEIK